jgi:hypothetical protein
MYFGMLAASRISRSTSFFRYFSVIHPRSEVYSLVTFEYLAMSVSEGYSARSWAKETGKNSGKEQILTNVNLLIYNSINVVNKPAKYGAI